MRIVVSTGRRKPPGNFILRKSENGNQKIISWRNCDVASVKPESKFSELGIDSLDTVELLMNLEDEIGIEIELDQKVETIDDLDKFIQSKKG